MSTYSLILLISTISASPVSANPNGELLEFTATWCGPCQRISPMIMQLKRSGWPIRKIDVDKNPELAKQYGITAMPSFVLVINGKPQLNDKIVGGTDAKTLMNLMKRIPRTSSLRNKKSVPVLSVADGKSSGKKGFVFPWGGKKKKASQQIIIEHNEEEPDVVLISDNPKNKKKHALKIKKLAHSSTVRLKVEDKEGVKYGTGTIIENREGFLVVLTCGHVLRGVNNSMIKVDLFTAEGLKTVTGKQITHNMESDVGLISVKTNIKMPVVNVASISDAASRGDALFSVGCAGGKDRTVEEHKVTSINRYHGPDNVECSGVPAVGRSGGGLFNQNGEIVGVCSAADRNEKRGIYAGLEPIHQILKKSRLDELIQETGLASTDLPNEGIQPDFEIDVEEKSAPKKKVSRETSVQDINELVKMAGENAEIVCIIRPANQPASESRVIVINKASKKLMEYLTGDVPEASSQVTVSKETVSKDAVDGRTFKPVLKKQTGKRWVLKKNKNEHLKPTSKFVRKPGLKKYRMSAGFLNSL
jgi:thiol-disulfide isomerase/thioredoxin